MSETISLLIITYNRPGDLLELLQSIRRQQDISALKEILILDNASTISYAPIIDFASQHPDMKIRYILSDENLGVSRGRNKLMQMAAGELLLVVDDDILFTGQDDLAKIATAFNHPFFQDANTGVIAFRIIYHETKELQLTAFPHKQLQEYSDKPVFFTSHFIGCAHLLRREVLAKTGLYPEDFFYGMEEYDLSYRIIKAGYTIGYNSVVTIEHKESPTGRKPHFERQAWHWVNKSKVAWRYLPRIYYLSTMIAWSIEYIRKVEGHWGTWFKAWGKALRIPFSEKRMPIGKKALTYLKNVRARLWY